LEKYGITVKLFADDAELYVKITNDVDLCFASRHKRTVSVG